MPLLPEEFINYTAEIFGRKLWDLFLSSFDEPPQVSVRLNPWKSGAVNFPQAESVPWCQNGYWLKGRPNFTLDPLLHAGAYYVQEAGSMFLDTVLRQYVKEPVCALDLCAAPGGKSTLMRAALPEGSLLVSNETDGRRASILKENLIKQGHSGVVITNNHACDYKRAGIMFNVILTDVPCSGEGLFRRDLKTVGEWNVKNVLFCQKRQREILKDIWPCLRGGGLLIYSTCTFNLHENEENILWLTETFGAEVLPVDIKKEWNITGSLLKGWDKPVYRFIPGKTRSEGLFTAVLRKPESGGICAAARPDLLHAKIKSLRDLYVIYDGNPAPLVKGKEVIPSVAQALSLPAANKYPKAELTLDTVLKYLHREAIILPPEIPLGYVIVCYKGQPLGFVKNLGTRANNLYPKEWAIKKL